jgi:DNA mismatch repair protein MutS2
MISANSLKLLEFDKLLRTISELANSEASKKSVLEIIPLLDRQEIETRLGRISELRRMSQEGDPVKLSFFTDILGLLAKARPEGSVLEATELAEFVPVLSIISGLVQQFSERLKAPLLMELTGRLTGFPDIQSLLKKSVDSEGNILDTASSLLSELRALIRRHEAKIRKRLEEIVRDESFAVFLQDDFITTRSGRWVIPVRMDSKGQVQGVVHDVSRSGETAFVEPLAIISMANELENMKADQKSEEIRILRDISSKIRFSADEIGAQYNILVELDVLNSIGRFAGSLRMENALINETGIISLTGARHPLLMLAFAKIGGSVHVVPLDVRLGGNDTVMVITGSNAGGKTIAIKTIGLLLIMALSGMPVPADSSSSFPLVHNLLIDIGDEQSIENNLSTFSAHVTNISGILKSADQKSLVLIDELGTGTDPAEGAALACAVLKEIKASGSLVFATTHLTDIKGFVYRTEGMINASMEFDQNTLMPLYRLRTGEPGQSHALEIAGKYGLPESIIDSAKSMLGGIKIEFDNLIADLNRKRAAYEKMLDEVQHEKSAVEEKLRQLEQKLADAEANRKSILAEAYKEAGAVITDIKRQMHALLDKVKKEGREKAREAIRQAAAEQEKVGRKLRGLEVEEESSFRIDQIAEGDTIYVISLGYDARVAGINLKHDRVKVITLDKEIEVPVSDILAKKGKQPDVKRKTEKSEKPDESVNSRINLIGLRVDEALSRLEPFLNHASLAGLGEVTIIHGIGKGLLSKAVREHITEHPLVVSFRSGKASEGGAGVTIVTMG